MLDVSESAVRELTNPDHRSPVSQVQKALRAVGPSDAPWSRGCFRIAPASTMELDPTNAELVLTLYHFH